MAATSGDHPARSTGRPEALSLGIPGLEVKGQVGSGIRGTVYAVTDGRRTLALKVLRRGIHVDREALSRLGKGAPNRIRHPNLAPVELIGELPDGSIYYASPFLRGDSLDRLLHDLRRGASDQPSLSVFSVDLDGSPHPQLTTRGTELFAEALEGLALLHHAGIVHRRLSPRNFQLTPAGRLVITDFGGDATTEAGSELVYCAPEQLDPYPERVGPQADVYSIGVILYESLTRKKPFDAQSPRELKESIQEGRFPPPGKFVEMLPGSLEACVLRAMAFDPADRYPDAGAFAADLRTFLRGEEPVAMRSVARPEPREPWIDWRVWLRVAAAAVILGAFVIWLWPRKDVSEDRVLSLNPGLLSEDSGATSRAAGASGLAPQAQIIRARTNADAVAALPQETRSSLEGDPIARELAGGNAYARAAALTRLRLEIENGARPASDSLIAAWAVHENDSRLRAQAIEMLGAAGDGDSILRLLAIGPGSPPASFNPQAFRALHDALRRIGDSPAVSALCEWDLDASEQADRVPAPASIHLDPNLRLEIAEGSPRDLTALWIRARAGIDPASLLEVVPRLAAREDVLGELITALRGLGTPASRDALVRIVLERGYSGGRAALNALRDLGAQAEILDLARSELPVSLRAEALRILGADFGELSQTELITIATTSPETELRRIAFHGLSELDDSEALAAIPSLIRDPELRESALEWAARMPQDGSTGVLIELLGENDFDARALATERLKSAGPRDLLAPLVDRLLDSRRFTRECALEVLFARGELPRIPEAVARVFGRPARPVDEAAQVVIEVLRGALGSVGPMVARVKTAAAGAVVRTFDQIWVGTGLAHVARILLRQEESR